MLAAQMQQALQLLVQHHLFRHQQQLVRHHLQLLRHRRRVGEVLQQAAATPEVPCIQLLLRVQVHQSMATSWIMMEFHAAHSISCKCVLSGPHLGQDASGVVLITSILAADVTTSTTHNGIAQCELSDLVSIAKQRKYF